MSDQREAIDELAGLIEEFKLERASLQVGDFKIAFGKRRKVVVASGPVVDMDEPEGGIEERPEIPPVPQGNPVTSPMTGIYYSSPSPGASPFVSPGDSVTAGQVVGLIEAMKVFNEITSPFSGTVSRMVIESGAVVQAGDVLIYLA